MGVVRVKDGVTFNVIAPAGFRILSAIDQVAGVSDFDLRITSGDDGEHSGPTDPHKLGEAYDVGSKEHPPDRKTMILNKIMNILGFDRFYGFLESPDTESEHFHFQRKKGTTYP